MQARLIRTQHVAREYHPVSMELLFRSLSMRRKVRYPANSERYVSQQRIKHRVRIPSLPSRPVTPAEVVIDATIN